MATCDLRCRVKLLTVTTRSGTWVDPAVHVSEVIGARQWRHRHQRWCRRRASVGRMGRRLCCFTCQTGWWSDSCRATTSSHRPDRRTDPGRPGPGPRTDIAFGGGVLHEGGPAR